jgi:hypothetical protein
MWATIAAVGIILAQAAQPLGPGSKGQEWCFDRGQGAQLWRSHGGRVQPIAGDQYRDRAKPVQTCTIAGGD